MKNYLKFFLGIAFFILLQIFPVKSYGYIYDGSEYQVVTTNNIIWEDANAGGWLAPGTELDNENETPPLRI